MCLPSRFNPALAIVGQQWVLLYTVSDSGSGGAGVQLALHIHTDRRLLHSLSHTWMPRGAVDFTRVSSLCEMNSRVRVSNTTREYGYAQKAIYWWISADLVPFTQWNWINSRLIRLPSPHPTVTLIQFHLLCKLCFFSQTDLHINYSHLSKVNVPLSYWESFS